MALSFWFTVQIGRRRIPIPLVLLLPFALLLDALALVFLCIYGVRKRPIRFLKIAAGFHLSRLTLALLLYGGRFRVGVRDKNKTVRVFGGLKY